eukprot:5305450-Prymnesium_polylepis.1
MIPHHAPGNVHPSTNRRQASIRVRPAGRRCAYARRRPVGDDILRTLFGLLANPLEPGIAVPLASCCKSIREQLMSELKRLLDQHQNARQLCTLFD